MANLAALPDRIILGPTECDECHHLIYWGRFPGHVEGEVRWRELSSSMPHVCNPPAGTCPCGGDADFEHHDLTIRHMRYLLSQPPLEAPLG